MSRLVMEVHLRVEQSHDVHTKQRRSDSEEELRSTKELGLIRDGGSQRGEASVPGVALADDGAMTFVQ